MEAINDNPVASSSRTLMAVKIRRISLGSESTEKNI